MGGRNSLSCVSCENRKPFPEAPSGSISQICFMCSPLEQLLAGTTRSGWGRPVAIKGVCQVGLAQERVEGVGVALWCLCERRTEWAAEGDRRPVRSL